MNRPSWSTQKHSAPACVMTVRVSDEARFCPPVAREFASRERRKHRVGDYVRKGDSAHDANTTKGFFGIV